MYRLSIGMMVVLSACGKFDKDNDSQSGGGDGSAQTGCVQGVVTDGISGKRIALTEPKAGKQGLYVIVNGDLLPARTAADNASKETPESLKGEYSICGVPLDQAFPLVAWSSKYQSFEGIVTVPSSVAQRTPNSEQDDIRLARPTFLADIQLFPLGTETQDLTFKISDASGAVNDAKVILRPTGNNLLSGSRVLVPQIRSMPQAQNSDGLGKVIFDAENLVLGGEYAYTVLPPNGGSTLKMATGVVTVGLRERGMALDKAAYEIEIILDRSVSPAN